jgi:hypothetical protein
MACGMWCGVSRSVVCVVWTLPLILTLTLTLILTLTLTLTLTLGKARRDQTFLEDADDKHSVAGGGCRSYWA